MSAPHDPWQGIKKYWATVTDRMRGAEQFYPAGAVDAARAADAARHQAEIEAIAVERDNARAEAERNPRCECGGDEICAMGREIATLRATVDQQQARIKGLEADLMNQIDNSVALAHTVQAREARITELETALKDLLIAVTFAHTVEFTPENHCWEARVPVAFVEQARQALETP